MKKRITSIDLLRCFGIILMIMGHVGFGSVFSKIIHSFHMPLFFVISGLCFAQPISINAFIKKKSMTLLVPYLTFGLFSYFFYVLIQIVHKGDISILPLQRLFSYPTSGLAITGALWFLVALFISVVAFAMIYKIKNKILRFLIILFIFSFGLLSKKIFGYELPFAISQACVGVGFIFFGYLIKQFKIYQWLENRNLEWLKIIIIVALCSFGLFFAHLNSPVNMRLSQYSNIFLFLLSSIFIIAAILILFIEIDKLNFTLLNKVKQPFLQVGEYSIVFLCLNEIVIYVLRIILRKVIANDLVNAIVTFAITILILYALHFLFIKTKLRYLIGIRKK